MKGKDLTRKVFGRLTVLGFSHTNNHNLKYWYVKCECGNSSTVRHGHLTGGATKSCGCITKERMTTHGMSGTPAYKSWQKMLTRCNNSNDKRYNDYGGRGIKVCDRWYDFENFLQDMGERPKGMSIERIHNDSGYYPMNCKWATRKEQMRNRRNNYLVTYNGKTKPLVDWAEELGINYSTLSKRLSRGWTVERAMVPVV
jgi:hypothetical protein